MKKLFLIFLLCCAIAPIYAQKMGQGIEYKYNIEAVINAPSVFWYGFDVSNSHMLDFAKFQQGKVILGANIPAILSILEKIYTKKYIKRLTQKDSVVMNMVTLQDLYENIDPDKFIVRRNIEISIDSIKTIVKNYILPQKEGMGLVVIVEMFNKPEKYVTGYVTFFDMATREVFYATKMKDNPGGKGGFNYYWGNGIINLTRTFFYGNIYRNLK